MCMFFMIRTEEGRAYLPLEMSRLFSLMAARSVLCEVRIEALYKNRIILILRGLIAKFCSIHGDI